MSEQENKNNKNNTFGKIYNYFFVYLPVTLIFGLMLCVYLSYIFQYLKYFIKADTLGNEDNFIFHYTSSLKNAKSKGLILLIISLTFFIFLMISFFKTVFCNPGYYPNPLELEYKIITSGSKFDENTEKNYLSKFSDNLLDGPLTGNEKQKLESSLRKNCSERMKEDKLNLLHTNEEIIEINKREYMEHFDDKNTKASTDCSPNKDVFLDIYKGIDLTKMTFCGTCLRFKVERSHHCRQCQKCVLKMDHHCPWLANCIGFYNIKFFLLIQLYGILSCVLFALTYWESIVGFNLSYEANMGQCWFTITVYLLNIGLLAFLIWLALLNWGNVFRGESTIEHSDRKKFSATKKKNEYDMGPYRNFTNIFGRNPLVWFLPFFPNLNGSGFVYETNKDFRIK